MTRIFRKIRRFFGIGDQDLALMKRERERKLRAAGMSRREAAIVAGKTRSKPK
tara:strand:+ start:8708 stop:8866 length:159 start_codon:yes stop_codon:yes gene_type:complete